MVQVQVQEQEQEQVPIITLALHQVPVVQNQVPLDQNPLQDQVRVVATIAEVQPRAPLALGHLPQVILLHQRKRVILHLLPIPIQ